MAELLYDMNFAAGAALHASFTHTRATAAWRRNSSGLWESVASGVLRYHHTAAGSPLGILVESARTSRALHDRDLTQTPWTKTNCTAAKDATGIDGIANSASTLTATAASATCLQSITLASGARVFHPWVRRKTGTGTVRITLNGGTSWTDVTGSISATFARVMVTATVTDPQVGFEIQTSGDEIEVDFAELADGTFATSPIETAGAAVTRNADVITGPVAPAVMSVMCAGVNDVLATATALIFCAQVNASNRITIGYSTSALLALDVVVAAASQAALTTSIAPSTSFKVAVRVQENDFASSRGGAAATTDTSGSVPAACPLYLGSRAGGSWWWNSTIAHFKLWDYALSNAELQAESGTLVIDNGSVAVIGDDLLIFAPSTVEIDTGALTVAGSDLSAANQPALDAGAIATPTSEDISAAAGVALDTGSTPTVAGTDFLAPSALALETGSIALAGTELTLLEGSALILDTGAIDVIAANDIVPKWGLTLAAGSIAVEGNNLRTMVMIPTLRRTISISGEARTARASGGLRSVKAA